MVTESVDPLLETRPQMRPGELIIHLKKARHIKGHEFLCLGKANMYALFTMGGEKHKSKVVRHGGSKPVWDEDLSFKIAEYVHFSLYNTLYLHLYDDDVRRDSHRGTVKIDVASLLDKHDNEVPVQNFEVMYKNKPKGSVELGLTFIPSNRKPLFRVKSP